MDIKTNRSAQTRDHRIVPPPDKARNRKKTVQRLGRGTGGGRRYIYTFKMLANFGIVLLVFAFVFSVYMHAFSSEKFNLRTVKVYGCKEINPKQLEEIIRRDFPSNILRIDLSELQSRLEKEKWVDHVEIRRVLPSDIILYVHERIPCVILELGGQLMIADKEGKLLGRYLPGSRKLDVPVFRGIMGKDADDYHLYEGENTARIWQALQMLAELNSGPRQYTKSISEVDVSNRNNLKIILVDDAAEVHLGNKDYLKRFAKLANNLGEYQRLKDQYGEFEKIDLRFENEIVYLPIRGDSGTFNNQRATLEIPKADR